MSKRGQNKDKVLEDVKDIDDVVPQVKIIRAAAQNLPVFYSPMKAISNDKI